jgi:tripartite-type tricarboxylate transporter receptor subunit TctC
MRNRRFAVVAAVGGFALLFSTAFANVATAVTSHKKLTPLQQGLNFYKGKTITIISPDFVGGGYDATSRAVAPFLASYLGATVNVENDGPAVTVAGQDLAEASTPNGLTVGMLDTGVDIEDQLLHLTGVNFNPTRVAWLGGQGTGGGAQITCNTTPPAGQKAILSFADLVAATAADPVTELTIVTGGQTLDLQLLDAAFGIHYKFINAYQESANVVAGLERGDGECASQGNVTLGSYVQGGKGVFLFQSDVPLNPATAFYSEVEHLPTFDQEAAKYKATTKQENLARVAYRDVTENSSAHTFFLQTKAPYDEVLAMRAAIKAAFENPQTEDRLLQAGEAPTYTNGTKAKAQYFSEYDALAKVKTILAEAVG